MGKDLRHRHTYITNDNVGEEERASITKGFREVAEELGLRTVHVWEGQRHGHNAIFFGSDDLREHALLQIRLFGEAIGVGNHRHKHTFVGSTAEYERAWVLRAKSVLADQGIRYLFAPTTEKHACVFSFNRCSDYFYFSSLIEHGYIDALIRLPLLQLPYRRRDFLTPPCDVG